MSNESLFNDSWLELQRQYWETLTNLSRRTMGMEGAPGQLTSPWENAVESWWKMLSPTVPEASRTLMDKLIEQGKVFFRFGEVFATKAPGEAAASNDVWTFWSKTVADLQKSFSGATGVGGDETIQRMMSAWELPLDNWQRMMSSMSPLPGDALRNMPHEHLNRALSAPGLGYTREEQGQYQDLIRSSLEYQKVLQDYIAFYNRLGVKSVERMGSYLQSVISSGKSIDSARALYDNWVMCCETVYAEEVATPEYAKLHGNLVNAQMAVKRRLAIMVDENLGAMNMPSRAELRTLQDRLQETRRENKQLRQGLHALELQVAALAGTPAPPPALAIKSVQPATRAPVRRKTTARTSSTT